MDEPYKSTVMIHCYHYCLHHLVLDRSFEDDDSVDGNRSSSAQAAFKVPKVPKKPAESSAARRPSATSGKLGASYCTFTHK